MKAFSHFSNLIPKVVAKYNMGRETRAALVCKRFRDLAKSEFGEDLGAHIHVKFFKKHTLYLAVENSLWAQVVYNKRHDLLLQLNEGLEDAPVHEIRTQVSNGFGENAEN